MESRFYERMGLAVPREAHTLLFVNGAYAGLYAVVESIDKDFVRRPGFVRCEVAKLTNPAAAGRLCAAP